MISKTINPKIVDCTLRDGGYYNSWDFPIDLVNNYLVSMSEAKVDYVEIGFRFLNNDGFKGAHAFTTDNYIKTLNIPDSLIIGVMINASDLYTNIGWKSALEKLFPETKRSTSFKLVRIACHFHEIPYSLLASEWLKKKGFKVGLNLMQIADRKKNEIIKFGKLASNSKLDVIYFADSMGSLKPKDISLIIDLLKKNWKGAIGIHTHDNMGLALANTLAAFSKGATWLDATVTGMGRGPGNTRTEELLIELQELKNSKINNVPLLSLIRSYFNPLKKDKEWGTNPYYYLSGKYGIHPTYIQIMMGDQKYNEEDILGVIDYLKENGGKKFDFGNLDVASQFYHGAPKGTWSPKSLIKDREILILGPGPSVIKHKKYLENFIKKNKPLVLALNIHKNINSSFIDLFIASHPVRLLADAATHSKFPQPLVVTKSMLPKNLLKKLGKKKIFDFGIKINQNSFEFNSKHCVIPNPVVLSYALALCESGKASTILMAGFDGYEAGDTRNEEIEKIIRDFYNSGVKKSLISITPTKHKGLISKSLYGL